MARGNDVNVGAWHRLTGALPHSCWPMIAAAASRARLCATGRLARRARRGHWGAHRRADFSGAESELRVHLASLVVRASQRFQGFLADVRLSLMLTWLSKSEEIWFNR